MTTLYRGSDIGQLVAFDSGTVEGDIWHGDKVIGCHVWLGQGTGTPSSFASALITDREVGAKLLDECRGQLWRGICALVDRRAPTAGGEAGIDAEVRIDVGERLLLVEQVL